MTKLLADRYRMQGSFDRLVEGLDPAWVDEALEASGTATVRQRRLPAESVVTLVLGMAIYRDMSITEVVDHLRLALPVGGKRSVAPSAPTQARARLGDEPVQFLFERCARKWGHEAARRHEWRGLALYGVDGTTVRVPDSPANRATFGAHNAGGDRGAGSYPLLRLVTLMALRTHLLAAARFGSFKTGELSLAAELWQEVPDQSLCIVDRAFLDVTTLNGLRESGTERHWLTRGKTKTKLKLVKKLGRNDELVEIVLSKATRHAHPEAPKQWLARAVRYQRPGFAPQLLLTSMLDPKRWPAAELAALYHERWEMELGYDEVKTEMLEREESLPSQAPRGVAQELWGLGLAYNLVRLEMEKVAKEAGVPPNRISFVLSLHFIRNYWYVSALAPSKAGKRLAKLRGDLSRFVLPERRSKRVYPRAVKLKMSSYDRKRPAKALTERPN